MNNNNKNADEDGWNLDLISVSDSDNTESSEMNVNDESVLVWNEKDSNDSLDKIDDLKLNDDKNIEKKKLDYKKEGDDRNKDFNNKNGVVSDIFEFGSKDFNNKGDLKGDIFEFATEDVNNRDNLETDFKNNLFEFGNEDNKNLYNLPEDKNEIVDQNMNLENKETFFYNKNESDNEFKNEIDRVTTCKQDKDTLNACKDGNKETYNYSGKVEDLPNEDIEQNENIYTDKFEDDIGLVTEKFKNEINLDVNLKLQSNVYIHEHPPLKENSHPQKDNDIAKNKNLTKECLNTNNYLDLQKVNDSLTVQNLIKENINALNPGDRQKENSVLTDKNILPENINNIKSPDNKVKDAVLTDKNLPEENTNALKSYDSQKENDILTNKNILSQSPLLDKQPTIISNHSPKNFSSVSINANEHEQISLFPQINPISASITDYSRPSQNYINTSIIINQDPNPSSEFSSLNNVSSLNLSDTEMKYNDLVDFSCESDDNNDNLFFESGGDELNIVNEERDCNAKLLDNNDLSNIIEERGRNYKEYKDDLNNITEERDCNTKLIYNNDLSNIIEERDRNDRGDNYDLNNITEKRDCNTKLVDNNDLSNITEEKDHNDKGDNHDLSNISQERDPEEIYDNIKYADNNKECENNITGEYNSMNKEFNINSDNIDYRYQYIKETNDVSNNHTKELPENKITYNNNHLYEYQEDNIDFSDENDFLTTTLESLKITDNTPENINMDDSSLLHTNNKDFVWSSDDNELFLIKYSIDNKKEHGLCSKRINKEERDTINKNNIPEDVWDGEDFLLGDGKESNDNIHVEEGLYYDSVCVEDRGDNIFDSDGIVNNDNLINRKLENDIEDNPYNNTNNIKDINLINRNSENTLFNNNNIINSSINLNDTNRDLEHTLYSNNTYVNNSINVNDTNRKVEHTSNNIYTKDNNTFGINRNIRPNIEHNDNIIDIKNNINIHSLIPQPHMTQRNIHSIKDNNTPIHTDTSKINKLKINNKRFILTLSNGMIITYNKIIQKMYDSNKKIRKDKEIYLFNRYRSIEFNLIKSIIECNDINKNDYKEIFDLIELNDIELKEYINRNVYVGDSYKGNMEYNYTDDSKYNYNSKCDNNTDSTHIKFGNSTDTRCGNTIDSKFDNSNDIKYSANSMYNNTNSKYNDNSTDGKSGNTIDSKFDNSNDIKYNANSMNSNSTNSKYNDDSTVGKCDNSGNNKYLSANNNKYITNINDTGSLLRSFINSPLIAIGHALKKKDWTNSLILSLSHTNNDEVILSYLKRYIDTKSIPYILIRMKRYRTVLKNLNEYNSKEIRNIFLFSFQLYLKEIQIQTETDTENKCYVNKSRYSLDIFYKNSIIWFIEDLMSLMGYHNQIDALYCYVLVVRYYNKLYNREENKMFDRNSNGKDSDKLIDNAMLNNRENVFMYDKVILNIDNLYVFECNTSPFIHFVLSKIHSVKNKHLNKRRYKMILNVYKNINEELGKKMYKKYKKELEDKEIKEIEVEMKKKREIGKNKGDKKEEKKWLNGLARYVDRGISKIIGIEIEEKKEEEKKGNLKGNEGLKVSFNDKVGNLTINENEGLKVRSNEIKRNEEVKNLNDNIDIVKKEERYKLYYNDNKGMKVNLNENIINLNMNESYNKHNLDQNTGKYNTNLKLDLSENKKREGLTDTKYQREERNNHSKEMLKNNMNIEINKEKEETNINNDDFSVKEEIEKINMNTNNTENNIGKKKSVYSRYKGNGDDTTLYNSNENEYLIPEIKENDINLGYISKNEYFNADSKEFNVKQGSNTYKSEYLKTENKVNPELNTDKNEYCNLEYRENNVKKELNKNQHYKPGLNIKKEINLNNIGYPIPDVKEHNNSERESNLNCQNGNGYLIPEFKNKNNLEHESTYENNDNTKTNTNTIYQNKVYAQSFADFFTSDYTTNESTENQSLDDTQFLSSFTNNKENEDKFDMFTYKKKELNKNEHNNKDINKNTNINTNEDKKNTSSIFNLFGMFGKKKNIHKVSLSAQPDFVFDKETKRWVSKKDIKNKDMGLKINRDILEKMNKSEESLDLPKISQSFVSKSDEEKDRSGGSNSLSMRYAGVKRNIGKNVDVGSLIPGIKKVHENKKK